MIDTTSATWAAVAEYLRTSIASERARNDESMPEAETAALRGRISAFKELLALPERQQRQAHAEALARSQPQPVTFMTPDDY